MEQKPTPKQLDQACVAICKSGKFETGQGTCALICMDQLGSARSRPCHHAVRVHGDFATAILQSDQQQAELLRALEPFALVAEHDIGEDEADHDLHRHIKHNRAPRLTVGDFRRAFREWQGGRSE